MAGLAVDGAVAAAVMLVWLGALGTCVMPQPLVRLHYAAPAGTLAPVAAATAAVIHEATAQAAVKPVLVAALMVAEAPVLAHALGTALHRRPPP